jgi:hypothetical protein
MEVYTIIEVITFVIMMLICRPRPLIVGLCRFPTIHGSFLFMGVWRHFGVRVQRLTGRAYTLCDFRDHLNSGTTT